MKIGLLGGTFDPIHFGHLDIAKYSLEYLELDKVLFIPAYKFFQETKETWKNGEFVSIDGFTDFEDDREYKIIGNDEDNFFIASGMDGELKLDKRK